MTRIGYILRSYPRLSQTFIVNEILALEQLGLDLHLFAITNPREPIVQAQVAQVRAPIEYLEEAARRERSATRADHAWAEQQWPRRYAEMIRYVEQRADLDQGYVSASRFECLDQAVYLAQMLERERSAGRPIDHLHAHFAHDPTLIALLVRMLTGISFSFTAHARDLVQIPPDALIERIDQATAMLTCSGTNIDYVNDVVPEPLRAKVHLIYHGVNLDGFQPLPQNQEPRTKNQSETNGSRSSVLGSPPVILSVGRLVEKKGFPDLIAACALLRQAGRAFRFAIYGGGPLHDELSAQIERLKLADHVTLEGERSQKELIPIIQRADIFALAPFVTEDGDRDGIPNVLVEAMACGLPVVSTTVAGIPELVQHGQNGLLVAPRDTAALADALLALLDDQGRRIQLGAAARASVVEHFDLRSAARRIAALFEQATGAHTHAALNL
ncbi:MAG TPA: glycosyltransferase [Roseiflexaceae bacterium]|nr:glycosyltransferase [Roseiflexaceae bacterium]